jgi:hypothetical protein
MSVLTWSIYRPTCQKFQPGGPGIDRQSCGGLRYETRIATLNIPDSLRSRSPLLVAPPTGAAKPRRGLSRLRGSAPI